MDETKITPENRFPRDPIGEGLSLDSMRQLAAHYGATSYVDRTFVDATDYGYLMNPNDAAGQFGVSTYKSAHNGFDITHSMVAIMPKEARAGSHSSNGMPAFIPVIDITLPYSLPHMIMTPKMEGALSTILSTFTTKRSFYGVRKVRLEGDFSEYLDVYVGKDEEDITPFVYLAPDVMDEALKIADTVIIEWVGNHIYIYYRPNKTGFMREYNTMVTGLMYEKMLRTGLTIADRLGKNARPIGSTKPPTLSITRMNVFTGIIIPILVAGIILYNVSRGFFHGLMTQDLLLSAITGGILGVVVLIIAGRLVRAARLRRKYYMRYGKTGGNIQ